MIVVGSILVGLLLWNPQKILYPVRLAVSVIAMPFERIFSGVGFYIASSLEFLSSVGALKQENEALVGDNIRLMAENAKLVDMQKENEILRKQFELLPRDTFQLKAAEVIGFDEQNSGNWLMINRGSSDGIESGMVVIVDKGAVVGRVTDVLPGNAKVLLLTSPESVVNGIDAQTEAKGIVRGQYGLGMVMDTVLQSDTLTRGDSVVTSGLGGEFPRGLFLGNVDAAHPSPDRLFQQVTLIPMVNFLKLRTVFVITGNVSR